MQAGLPYFNVINIPSFVNETSTVIIVNIFHWMFVQAEDPPTSAPALVTSPSAAVVSPPVPCPTVSVNNVLFTCAFSTKPAA